MRIRRSYVVVITAALLLSVAGEASASAGGTADRAAAAHASVTVDVAHPAGPLAADFVGLSYEQRELSVGSFDAKAGNLAQLFKTLGASNLRIGGNTLDRDSLWVPAGQKPPNPLPSWVKNVVTPADIARLAEFLSATGWKAEVGVNTGRWNQARDSDQVRTMLTALGGSLTAVACGNEPNAWVSHGVRSHVTYAEYKTDWEKCATAAGGKVSSPDTSSPGSSMPKFDQFARDEHTRMAMLTTHNYAVGGSASVTELLSAGTLGRQVSRVAGAVQSARSVKLPIRLDETNTAAGGGSKLVSDRYASALWAFDYSLALAKAGINGLDFHGGLGVCNAPLFNGKFQRYTPICPANDADRKARVYAAAPEYYGIYMAKRMAPGTFLPVTVSSDRNVTAYAVKGSDGRIQIAVIEKDETGGSVDVSISVGHGSGTAEAIRLTGPKLSSTSGVQIQGVGVDRSGRLPARPAEQLAVAEGHLQFSVGSGSAVLITLPAA